VISALSQILAEERLGLTTTRLESEAYGASKLAECAVVRHLRELEIDSSDLAPRPLPLMLPCAKTRVEKMLRSCLNIPTGAFQNDVAYRTIDALTITKFRKIAASRGVTLNSILLGTLATHFSNYSGQDTFAIEQTYLGRRSDQLNAVGSFSDSVAVQFTFDDKSSLWSTCRHVFKQTMLTMRSMAASEGAVPSSTACSNVRYELNDMRPQARPKVAHKNTADISCDLFFLVNEYVDGFATMVVYDVSKFELADVELLLDGWFGVWLQVINGEVESAE
jgi:hypothetical protein